MSKPKRDPVMHRFRVKRRDWRIKLRRRRKRLQVVTAHHADERAAKRSVRKARKAVAYLEHLIAKHRARRHGLDHEAVLDGTPMPLGQKLALLDARRHGWSGVATSGDRRDKPAWVGRLLHKLGKSTQRELWEGWINGLPGYLPANPPTQGTHMRIGDGVVGAVGEPLEWWQEGIDSTYGTQLREVLNRLGYDAYRPYSSASEEHHTNFRTSPHNRLIERGLV